MGKRLSNLAARWQTEWDKKTQSLFPGSASTSDSALISLISEKHISSTHTNWRGRGKGETKLFFCISVWCSIPFLTSNGNSAKCRCFRNVCKCVKNDGQGGPLFTNSPQYSKQARAACNSLGISLPFTGFCARYKGRKRVPEKAGGYEDKKGVYWGEGKGSPLSF